MDTKFKKGMTSWNTKPKLKKECFNCSKVFYVRPSWNYVKNCSKRCSMLGVKRSVQTKLKMSLASKGNTRTLGYKHTEDAKRNMSEAKKGIKNYLWIEDRTQLKDDSKERGGQLHREWSKNVKNRDGWKCKIFNGDCSGRLEAHHILGWKSHPDLRYETNNGITLCHFHHPRKRKDELELSPYFQSLVLKGN